MGSDNLHNQSGEVTNAPEAVQAHSALSQQVFSNPADFISTLQSHYNDIAPDGAVITLPELELYAKNGSDPKTRAAASIAAANFDQLTSLPDSTFNYAQGMGGISDHDLKFDLDVATDNQSPVGDKQADDVRKALALSAVIAAAAVATAYYPPLGIVGVPAVIGLSVAVGKEINNFSQESDNFQQQVQKANSTMGSWLGSQSK